MSSHAKKSRGNFDRHHTKFGQLVGRRLVSSHNKKMLGLVESQLILICKLG